MGNIKAVLGLMALAVAAGATGARAADPLVPAAMQAAVATPDIEARLAAIGLRIAPVPLNLAGQDRSLVGFGSYLVNLATCTGCHTNPEYAEGGDPFQGQKPKINKAGYLAGGTDFGIVLSANITPDKKGRPAGIDFVEFVAAMTKGRDPDDPKRLLQVMPWPAYKDLTLHELRAIYAYLSAIPSLPDKDAKSATAGAAVANARGG